MRKDTRLPIMPEIKIIRHPIPKTLSRIVSTLFEEAKPFSLYIPDSEMSLELPLSKMQMINH